MSQPESDGTRLGRMMKGEPELTKPSASDAGRDLISRFIAYVTADGSGASSMLTRMERLKFEAIVSGKSCGEVLAETESPD